MLQTCDEKGYVDSRFRDSHQGAGVAKDKKKDKKGKASRKDKKPKKGKGAAGLLSAKSAAKKIKDWTGNPLVADIVAAALVATASALKDSHKAQRLASDAGDDLERLSKKGAERGNALWQMALEIGRRSLEELAESGVSGGKARGKRG